MEMLREVAIKEVLDLDIKEAGDKDMEEGEVYPTTCFNYGDIFHVSIFCTKPHDLYGY